jgi:hypothetical protein
MDKFIKLLLETENTVILPNFGAIVVENETTGALMFNEYLKFNDGKLDNIIVENSTMDIQEAQNYIAKHIREIQAEIDKGNEYSIFELGSFSKDKDGSIIFQGNINSKNDKSKKENDVVAGPSPTPPKEDKQEKEDGVKKDQPKENINKKESEKVTKKKESQPTEEQEKKDADPKAIPVAEATKEKKKTTKENKYQEKGAAKKPEKSKSKEKKKKKGKKGPVFFILIFLLVVVAGGSTYIGLNYDEFKTMMGWDKFEEVKDPKALLAEADNETTPMDEDEPEEIVFDEEDEQGIQEEVGLEDEFEETEGEDIATEPEEEPEQEPKVEEPVTPKETPSTVSTNPSGVSGNFYIIAGTFSEQSNAEKLVADLKQQGYPAEIVGFLNNMHYVSVQSFSTRSDANNALSKISNDVPKAWVYKKP